MRKILVIDDSRTELKSLGTLLERAGFAVATASDGYKGIEAIKKEKPDLVILDILMPGISGYEVMHLIRFELKLTSLPIVLYTSEPHVFNPDSCATLGIDYLHKSCAPEELINKVSLILEPKGSKKEVKKKASNDVFQAFLDYDQETSDGITRIIEQRAREYKKSINEEKFH